MNKLPTAVSAQMWYVSSVNHVEKETGSAGDRAAMPAEIFPSKWSLKMHISKMFTTSVTIVGSCKRLDIFHQSNYWSLWTKLRERRKSET
jgi:hypothetical protein